jgi:hypothetical protein
VHDHDLWVDFTGVGEEILRECFVLRFKIFLL